MAVNDSLSSLDYYLSQDISVPGTKYQRGIFTSGNLTDPSGQELVVQVIVVPKNDGSGVMVVATSLKASEQQLRPVFDVIFKSLDLQPK